MDILVFSQSSSMLLNALNFSTIIQTDKTHYEPGQAVKIRAISLYPDGKPYKSPADITIKDPRQNLVQQWLLVENFLGVVSKEFQLSDNSRLGMWTISVSVNEVVSERNITVEYYVQPKFGVSVKVPSVVYYDSNWMGMVNAQYPYGKPVRGVLTVMAEFEFFGLSISANKTKEINGSADFAFTKNDFFEQFNAYEEYFMSMEPKVKLIVNVIAWVTETLTGLTYNRTMVVTMVNKKYNLEFYSLPRVLKPSLNFSAQLKVSLYDQSPLTLMDRVNNVTINVTQWGYFETNGTGYRAMRLSFPVPQNGIVDLRFLLLDQVSKLVILARFQDTVVTHYLARYYTSPSRSYIQIRRSSAPAHVTSRGRLVAAGTETSMSFSLTPEESWAPLAHLVVYTVDSDGEIVNDATFFPVKQIQRINVSLSWSQANVRPEEEVSLVVTVTEPGTLVGIWVVDQKPNCPQLSNDFTDEAVVNIRVLTDANLYPWYLWFGDLSYYFLWKGFPVTKPPPFPVPLEDANRIGDPTVQARVGPGAVEEMPVQYQRADWKPPVCRDSPETWLWLEANMSTSNTANLRFTVPDRITSWFASAFVVSENLGLGLMSTPAKNFFLSLDLPPYIIRGEQLILEIQLYNNLDQDLEAEVFVEESISFEFVFAGNQFASAGARSVTVRSQNSATVLFPVTPKVIGTMSVTVNAVSFYATNNVTRTVLVKSEGIEKTFVKSLFLELVLSDQISSRGINFTFPQDVVPGSQRAEVAAVGDILGPSLSGLESLIKMPYGCGEQNMINFAPSIYVLQYLNSTSQVEEDIHSRAISAMTKGYYRELSYQRIDGSFSAFGDRDASGSTWLSAFVLRCFLQARPFIRIDADILSQTATWLVSQQQPDGAFGEPGRVIHTELQGGLDGPVSLTAYVLMALLEDQTTKDLYASTVTNALLYLESKFADGISSNYSMCLVAYALSLSKRFSAQTALNELLNRADIKDGVVYWELPGGGLSASWQPRSANIEMAAYALLSFYTQTRVVEGLSLMKWLSQQRNHLGGYGSTQDTVVALQALSRYAEFSGSEAIDLWIEVITITSNMAAKFHINSENALLPQIQELNVFYNLDSSTLSRSSHGEAFDLVIRVTDNDVDHITLTVCTRLREGQQINRTGMVLVEATMLTGLRLAEGGVKTDDVVRNVEKPAGKVVLYLDSLTTSEVCIDIPTVRDFKVAKVQDATVAVYDYYEPLRRVEKPYYSETMRQISLCSFCGDDCSSCGEKPKSGSVSVSGLQQNNIRSLTCVLVILAAVML
ncbi:hypothetical protein SKAU_G00340830 [Synaphobranchus kaupii]|uniref:CD109 antigen-like n=1 Tax=Synaphobranchus kaupii TaxID=118154 RepID=A0A9Q1IJ71_SYNKA|nr:hypothetical protein SKAU_G00340830 [Synaphobranchus kaupii]